MDSSTVTADQRKKLAATTSRTLAFLNKLCTRMQRLHFPDTDPLQREAHRARDAMQRLADESRCPSMKDPTPQETPCAKS